MEAQLSARFVVAALAIMMMWSVGGILAWVAALAWRQPSDRTSSCCLGFVAVAAVVLGAYQAYFAYCSGG